MSRKTPEGNLKAACKQLLAVKGIWTFPILQGMGAHPGISDRLGLLSDGTALAIEFKTGRNKLTPKQLAFRDNWIERNGLYVECRSVEDLALALGIRIVGII